MTHPCTRTPCHCMVYTAGCAGERLLLRLAANPLTTTTAAAVTATATTTTTATKPLPGSGILAAMPASWLRRWGATLSAPQPTNRDHNALIPGLSRLPELDPSCTCVGVRRCCCAPMHAWYSHACLVLIHACLVPPPMCVGVRRCCCAGFAGFAGILQGPVSPPDSLSLRRRSKLLRGWLWLRAPRWLWLRAPRWLRAPHLRMTD